MDKAIIEELIKNLELLEDLEEKENKVYCDLDYLTTKYVGKYPILYLYHEIVDKPSGELVEDGKWVEYLERNEKPWLERGFVYFEMDNGKYLKLKFC